MKEKNKKLIEAIKHTGYILENDICNILEKNNWNVISNRYYVDNEKNIEREIDNIAYKVREIKGILYYTVLIISCKKSSKQIWTFLTKNIKQNDPNINYTPIFNKTNSRILNFMLDKHVNIAEKIDQNCDESISDKILQKIYGFEKNIFAVQQIEKNKDGYKAKNDNKIYDSIITSIKALNYESQSVLKKDKYVFYNFNLLSVFDGEMLEYYFNNNEISVNEIDEIKYLNRHIINKEENFYRVQFIKSSHFKENLVNYNKLHEWNCKIYSKILPDYYKECMILKGGLDLFLKEVKSSLNWSLNYLAKKELKGIEKYGDVNIIELSYNPEKSAIILGIDWNFSNLLEFLNSSSEINKRVAKCLYRYYKYKGEFYFDEGLPF